MIAFRAKLFIGHIIDTDEKDTDFSIRLTKEKGLASIPLSVFYTTQKQQQLLRFCFAKKEETL